MPLDTCLLFVALVALVAFVTHGDRPPETFSRFLTFVETILIFA